MARPNTKGLGAASSRVYRFRVPNDLLDAWERFTAEHGEDGQEVLRRVMAQLVNKPRPVRPKEGTTGFIEPSAMRTTEVVDRRTKKYIKLALTQDEYSILDALTDERECSVQFWIVSLVRAALTKGITVGGAELKALGESSYQLMAIGRNLNQIAHQINGDPSRHLHQVTPRLIEDLMGKITEHQKAVHALLDACSHRWKLSD